MINCTGIHSSGWGFSPLLKLNSSIMTWSSMPSFKVRYSSLVRDITWLPWLNPIDSVHYLQCFLFSNVYTTYNKVKMHVHSFEDCIQSRFYWSSSVLAGLDSTSTTTVQLPTGKCTCIVSWHLHTISIMCMVIKKFISKIAFSFSIWM